MTELNSQQAAAVQAGVSRVMVLAGAGSGKTRVLTERIAFLIEQRKVSPYEIMAITFTRKAAGEMRQRLEARIGTASYRLTVGTMHATALQMIKKFGETIGLKPKQVTVYSEWECEFLIKTIAIDLGLFKGKAWKIPKKEINAIFADYYERGQEPDKNHPAHGLWRTFIARCKENNALPYGALLVAMKLLIQIMRRNLTIKHILVDEVQDIDPMQWSIINNMCEAFGAALFIVGDVDQAIYEWRGAVPQYLIDHQAEFEIYRLEVNYRSDANVVNAANRLIQHNQNRIEKTMVPFEDAQTDIRLFHDMDSSRTVLLYQKLESKSSGVRRAILSRNHVLLGKLSQLLEGAGIEHEYVGQKSKITNTEEFRRFHAFLKLLVNPYDNFAFLLIKELIGIMDSEYSKIRFVAIRDGKSHFQVWYESEDLTKSHAAVFFNSEKHKILSYAATDLSYLIGLKFHLENPGQLCDVGPSLAFIIDWLSNDMEEKTVEQYLDWLATYDIQDELTERSKPLQLMTIHAAKGLEWPTVIIAGCNEGIIPSKQATDNDDIEAERRLMYVAMTRARDKLILAIRPTEKEGSNGKLYINPPSRFIGEAVLIGK